MEKGKEEKRNRWGNHAASGKKLTLAELRGTVFESAAEGERFLCLGSRAQLSAGTPQRNLKARSSTPRSSASQSGRMSMTSSALIRWAAVFRAHIILPTNDHS